VLIIPSLGVPNWLVIYINTTPSGAQDKELVLQVARQGLEKLVRLLPESLILNPESPLWENSLATSLCTWIPNELAHLLSVIKTIFGHRCWGTKASVHNCNFHGQEIISSRRETSFSTLQFPKLGRLRHYEFFSSF
jgi:hypothetical protein